LQGNTKRGLSTLLVNRTERAQHKGEFCTFAFICIRVKTVCWSFFIWLKKSSFETIEIAKQTLWEFALAFMMSDENSKNFERKKSVKLLITTTCCG